MGSELNIPDEAWELLTNCPTPEDIDRAAGLIVAADHERQARDLEDQAAVFGEPAADTPGAGTVWVLIDVARELQARAAELRGEGNESRSTRG